MDHLPEDGARASRVRCLLLTSHSSSLVLDDARVPVSANRYRCRTAPSERSPTFSSRVSYYRERGRRMVNRVNRENRVKIRHASQCGEQSICFRGE